MARWAKKEKRIGLPVGARNKKINDIILFYFFEDKGLPGNFIVRQAKCGDSLYWIGHSVIQYLFLFEKKLWFSPFSLIIFCITSRYLYGPMALLINGFQKDCQSVTLFLYV